MTQLRILYYIIYKRNVTNATIVAIILYIIYNISIHIILVLVLGIWSIVSAYLYNIVHEHLFILSPIFQ